MLQVRQHGTEGLEYYLFDLIPYFGRTMPVLYKDFEDIFKGTLVRHAFLLSVFASILIFGVGVHSLFKVLVLFVDCIVCNVNEIIVHIIIIRILVFLSAEACQAFLIDVASKWLARSDKHIHSQIKLQFVN